MKLIPFFLAMAVSASTVGHAAAPAKKSAKQSAQARKAQGKSQVKPRAPARPIDHAGEQVNFGEWQAVNAFADELALRHGFPRAELSETIKQIRYIDSAIQLVKPAPRGQPKNWQAYSRLTIEPVRIEAGVKFWNAHADALARAEAEYGVPAEIIVGIIGVETVYGRNTGRFRIMDVLTTLAFAYPDTPNRAARMAFFRGELENTLLLARKNNIDPFSLLGSFAGAIGLPQFMPGSVLAYAVDYDNDGTIDLRSSAVDAIGSVASFLVQHGWQAQQPGAIVYRAQVSAQGNWASFIGKGGLAATMSAEEMRAGGVTSTATLPPGLKFGLVDLQNGMEPSDYWLATDNFFAITQYNRSYFYAMSVIELGRTVRSARTQSLLGRPETL